ncbi:MAG: hypothetical protein ACM3Q4_00520 [Acidobacteriota bacterium]
MNTKHLVLAAVMIAVTAVPSMAQGRHSSGFSDAQMDRIEKNYAYALGMENKGVVEEALAIMTRFKLERPDEKLPKVMKEVRHLATHSKFPIIRYKACLAEAVFDHPALFEDIATRSYSDSKAFFNALEERMNSQLMSSN